MVEKKEFVILFIKKKISEAITEFIPHRVVEGIYDQENNWFNDTKDGIPYLHIDITPSSTVGYGCRTIIEFKKDIISKEGIEILKKEILDYANKFRYERDISKNECIIAINKENGDETLFEDIDNTPDFNKTNKQGSSNTNVDDILDITPQELEEKIKETIKGQDKAVRKIVTALWTTLNFRELKKKNMLIIGPTGVGKTAIFEKIKEILNIPVIIYSIPGLSQSGYVGRSVDEILKQVYYETEGDIDSAEKAIVILDEIDKIASTSRDSVSTTAVQNELLKIIEGCERYIEPHNPTEPSFTINTEDMIFVGTGAFQELFEKAKPKIGYTEQDEKNTARRPIDADKLIKYGMKRELVGRLPIVVELDNLGKEELKDIIINSDKSELAATVVALRQLGVEVENLEEVIDMIAEDALNKKIGARGLILTINNLFQEIFYEVGNNQGKYKTVVIGNNIINDNRDFILKKTKVKKRKKVKQG